MTQIRKTITHAAFFLSLISPTVFALTNFYEGNWFLGFGGGRSFYQMNGDNYVHVCPGCPPDHYYKNKIHDGSFLNLNGGYAYTRYKQFFPKIMVGLNLTWAFNGKVSGYINQFDLTEFKNYVYSYDFSRQSLMGILKVELFNLYGVMPFIMGGGGISYNRASGYLEEPLADVTQRVSPGYSTCTHSNRAYIVGAGFDFLIIDYLMASISWQYGNFGKVHTGHGRENASLTGLNYAGQELTNKLKANSVLMDFTYLIDV